MLPFVDRRSPHAVERVAAADEFGLARLLDGIAQQVARAAG
ncbi:hypothetical protein [Amycolatopsis sp. FDAARGOS 1241]|nr:hypothetical protein [Amycolatopsis sp. FDAARGOS 1241]